MNQCDIWWRSRDIWIRETKVCELYSAGGTLASAERSALTSIHRRFALAASLWRNDHNDDGKNKSTSLANWNEHNCFPNAAKSYFALIPNLFRPFWSICYYKLVLLVRIGFYFAKCSSGGISRSVTARKFRGVELPANMRLTRLRFTLIFLLHNFKHMISISFPRKHENKKYRRKSR